MRKAGTATCKVCSKSQSVNAFSPEFNPKGQPLTCKFCISRGQVYCPLHDDSHAKATLTEYKFKVGQECPHGAGIPPEAPKEITPAAAETPAPALNPATTLAHSFELIAKRLSALESVQESITRVDKVFASVYPLLESLVNRLEPVPSVNPEKIAELEAQAAQHKVDLEGAVAEWSKAEEKAKALEQRLAESEAALANLVASHSNMLAEVNNLDALAKKLL